MYYLFTFFLFIQECEDALDFEESYGILDILNRDCLDQILSYVPITDKIRTERVSKRWRVMIQEHLEGKMKSLTDLVDFCCASTFVPEIVPLSIRKMFWENIFPQNGMSELLLKFVFPVHYADYNL